MLQEIKTVQIKRDNLYQMFKGATELGMSVPSDTRMFIGTLSNFASARFEHSYPEDFSSKGFKVNWDGFWKGVGLQMPPTGLASDQKAEMVVLADRTRDVELSLASIEFKRASQIEVNWNVSRVDAADMDNKSSTYAILILPRDVPVSHHYNEHVVHALPDLRAG
jgi:hypothetical protein